MAKKTDANANADKEEQKVETQAQAAVPAAQEEKKPRARKTTKKWSEGAEEKMLFNKYSFKDVVVKDKSLEAYINLTTNSAFPNIYGRRANATYYATHSNIVERLVNKLMRGGTGQRVGGKVIRTKGRLQGKKLTVMHVVEGAFDSIHRQTNKNPIQVLVDALQNAAPIEDTTRVRYGGIKYNIAVDISSNRRLNLALRNIALASLISAFRSRKTLSDALANEIIAASSREPTSYAIKIRQETERIARSAR